MSGVNSCTHASVTCLNQHELIRKYQCEGCGGIMMCACNEAFGRRFLSHQLREGCELDTRRRVPVTHGFQPASAANAAACPPTSRRRRRSSAGPARSSAIIGASCSSPNASRRQNGSSSIPARARRSVAPPIKRSRRRCWRTSSSSTHRAQICPRRALSGASNPRYGAEDEALSAGYAQGSVKGRRSCSTA